MNAKQIIIEHLKSIGADGLCWLKCGCGVDNLITCKADPSECAPAIAHIDNNGDDVFVPMEDKDLNDAAEMG